MSEFKFIKTTRTVEEVNIEADDQTDAWKAYEDGEGYITDINEFDDGVEIVPIEAG